MTQKNMVKDERRKYFRLLEEDVLTCELFSAAAFGSTNANKIHTFTKSLSEGGILFESDVMFDIGAVLKLQIDLPGWEKFKPEFYKSEGPTSRKPLIVLGKVVRVEVVSAGRYDIGVLFSAVDSGHKLALKKYLDRARKNRE